MSAAREEILARVRHATRDVPAGESPAWEPPQAGPPAAAPAGEELLALLAERIADYRATVTRVHVDDVAAAVTAILARHDANRVVVPAGLPAGWRPAGVESIADDPPLDHDALDALDGVVTGCAGAIAETGTLVLDHGAAQGRRALTLLPDLHVCVVRAEQVLASVPAAIAAFATARGPVTFVSGPSATSDIELERVEGVHGPRRLEVVIAA
jgi:L-lactate dehydrogenase complex protein LldG